MLRRYEAVQKGAPARHLLLKTVGVEAGYHWMGTKDLWALHDERLMEYRELLKHADQSFVPEFKRPSLLDIKIELAARIMECCRFCEIRCKANRYKRPGACGVNATSHVYSEFLHYGEERELVPSHTIFFEGCTFACVYCQNWTIATEIRGDPVSPQEMCRAIGRRRVQGSRNVNLVGGDPTPHLHTILEIINCTSLNIPFIWNSNMYITPESMRLLEGAIDVFLGDFRYGNDVDAVKYSSAKNYWEVTTRAFLAAQEIAEVIVRQLVLPGHVECCTKPIVEWCTKNLGRDVRFNLMFQYFPEYRAKMYPEINRMLTDAEVRRALEIVKEAGLTNLV